MRPLLDRNWVIVAVILPAVLLAIDIAYGLVLRPASAITLRELTVPWALNAGLVTLAAALMGILVFGGGRAVLRRGGFNGSSRSTFRLSLLVVALSVPLLIFMARQPFVGNRYGMTSAAIYGPWLVAPALFLVAFLACLVVTKLVLLLLSPDTRAVRWWVGWIAAAMAGFLMIGVDAIWYVGWYPLIHNSLSLASALSVAVLSLSLYRRWIPGGGGQTFIVCISVPLALLGALGASLATPTDFWRVATGTIYGSRLITPILSLKASSQPSAEIPRLADVSPDVAWPTVLQRPVSNPTTAGGVLITVDTLRADRVGLYGATPTLTPNIDHFFRDGLIVKRAYTHYASTRNSIRSLLQSKYRPDARDELTDGLLTVLRDHGYRPVALLHDDLRLFVNLESAAFERVEFYDDPEQIVPLLRSITEGIPSASAFVWVHLYEPHDPYDPPGDLSTGRWPHQRYDGEVRSMDRRFEQVMETLQPSRDALVVLASDHGEEFFEHGGTLHGRTAYEETVRIPLLVRMPGTGHVVVEGPAGLLDVAPTILAGLGLPAPDSYQGFDIAGVASRAPTDRVLYIETVADAFGAVQGSRKWIWSAPTGLWELYDLSADPAERRNLADDDPELLRLGKSYIFTYRYQASLRSRLLPEAPEMVKEWLAGTNSTPSSSTLTRCVMFDLAREASTDARVRQGLRQAFDREPEEACASTILESLGRPGDAHEEAWFIDAMDRLARSVDPTIRRRAYAVFGGHPHGGPVLAAALKDPEPELRRTAARSLGSFPKYHNALLDLFSATDAMTRLGAAEGLASATSPVPATFWRAALSDSDPLIRRAAANGLRASGGPDARAMLLDALSRERSPSVRGSLLSGLLAASPAVGQRALEEEIARPTLTASVQARLIREHQLTDYVPHLVNLFTRYESRAFRRFIINAVGELLNGRPERQTYLNTLRSETFDRELRAEIDALLSAGAPQH